MSNEWMARLKNYAVVDVETTRNDGDGEIIEIGLVLARRSDLVIVEKWETKVRPVRLWEAQATALQVNGYNYTGWSGAPTLCEAMIKFGAKVKNAVFVGYNVAFDVHHLEKSFRESNVADESDDGYICLMRLAQLFIPPAKIENYKLATVCRYLGLPVEDTVHRAANGAECAYKLLKFFHTHRPDFSPDLIS